MKKKNPEWIVGLFVLIGILTIGGLILLFNKTVRFTPTYSLRLTTPNVGLLIPNAAVRMAGVPVGYVESVQLAADGKTVIIMLEIYRQYVIHSDARFLIEQIGFLGDQFIAIEPLQNLAPPLKHGDQVSCEEPFNLQEVARSAVGLIRRVDQTVARLDTAVTRLDQHLFSQETLTNLSATVVNFRRVSERAFTAVENLDSVLATNVPTIGLAMSNLVLFSHELNLVADDIREIVTTNREPINTTIQNFSATAVGLNEMVTNLNAGKGLAGFLLSDEEVRLHTSLLVSNLANLSSNLNRFGILYKPKRERPATPNSALYPGRRPSP